MDPAELEIRFPVPFRRTRLFVKKNPKVRKTQSLMKIIVIIFCIILFASWSYLNFYFYILITLKMLVVASIPLHIASIVSDSEEIVEYWKDKDYRKKIVKEKLFYTTYQIAQIFLISLVVFSLYHLTGMVNYWNTNELFPNIRSSEFQPTPIEALLLATVWILSAISIWTTTLWYTGQFVKIKRYSEEKKALVLDNVLTIALASFIVFFLFYICLYIFLDNAFIRFKSGGSFEGMFFLQNFAEKMDYWILAIESGIIMTFNVVTFALGKITIAKRENFVS